MSHLYEPCRNRCAYVGRGPICTSCGIPLVPVSEQNPAAAAFVRHMLSRLTEDGDLFWLCGPGTEIARLLCAAVAEVTGRPLEDVERELRQVTPRQPRTLFAKGERR